MRKKMRFMVTKSVIIRNPAKLAHILVAFLLFACAPQASSQAASESAQSPTLAPPEGPKPWEDEADDVSDYMQQLLGRTADQPGWPLVAFALGISILIGRSYRQR